MCTSSGGGSAARGARKEARRAREAEERRQAEIRNNMQMLDGLFEGGTFGQNAASNVDMGSAFFDRDGNQVYDGGMEMPEQRFLPIPGRNHFRIGIGRPHAGPLSGASPAIQRSIAGMRGRNQRRPTAEFQAFQNQQNRLQDMADNNNLFRERGEAQGFDDDYFQSQADAYRDFASPQLERQQRDAGNRLTYALSNAGTLGSSTGNIRRSDLEQDFARAGADVENRGQDIANQSRDAIARERQNLAGLVQQGVPMNNINSQVADLATRARQNSFDDLGSLFQNATAGIGNFEQGRRFGQISRDTPTFGPPGGGAGRAGSGRVVG